MVYEAFFEKVVMLMSLRDSSLPNLLHLLITFIQIYRDIHLFLSRKQTGKKVGKKDEQVKQPDIFFKIFRKVDPALILMSNPRYLDRVVNLLLYQDYETVELAVTLIKNIPILKHDKKSVFV